MSVCDLCVCLCVQHPNFSSYLEICELLPFVCDHEILAILTPATQIEDQLFFCYCRHHLLQSGHVCQSRFCAMIQHTQMSFLTHRDTDTHLMQLITDRVSTTAETRARSKSEHRHAMRRKRATCAAHRKECRTRTHAHTHTRQTRTHARTHTNTHTHTHAPHTVV